MPSAPSIKKTQPMRRSSSTKSSVLFSSRFSSSSSSSNRAKGAVLGALVAIFMVWWQPLFLEHPHRATQEAGFYTVHLLNKLTNSEGTLNALDRLVQSWMNHNSNNIPPAVGLMAPEAIVEMDASNFTPSTFLQASHGLKTPVVVKGLFRGSAATRKWTVDYLNETIGTMNTIALSNEENCFEQHTKSIHDRTTRTTSQCKKTLTVGDFLQRMQDERLYVTQMSHHFATNPSFLKDLELERFTEQVYPLEDLVVPTMFVGHGHEYPVVTTFHSAAPANYFIQIQGHKVWSILPPKWTPYFQPLYHADDTPALLSRCTCYVPETLTEQLCHADQLPIQSVTLEPGDFLYLPPWWWHEIKHVQPSEYFLGIGLRPVYASAWQFVPGISQAWASTLGTSSSYFKTFLALLKGDDWGSGFFHADDRNK